MVTAEGFMEREEVVIDAGIERWMPAYFQTTSPDTSEPSPTRPTLPELKALALTPPKHGVVDPTGGGNAFLGGFSIGLARGQPILEAVAWGSVAASFAIEQVGTPVLGKDEDGKEVWNGVNVDERLGGFLERCGLAGAESLKGNDEEGS